MADEQSIFLFFDDSGVFHKNNQTHIFVYAGYLFVGNKHKDEARQKYKRLSREIGKKAGIDGEVKAFKLKNKHKRALLRILNKYMRLAVIIDLSEVYDKIINDKRSRCRFKDYALKRLIKEAIKKLIENNEINPDKDVRIYLNVDEQSSSTNGVYDLGASVKEELQYGIQNFNYNTRYEPILHGDVKVILRYCQSENEYLIQAADILANTVYNDTRRGSDWAGKGIHILKLP